MGFQKRSFLKVFSLTGLCIGFNAITLLATPLPSNIERGTLGYDLDYLMPPSEAAQKSFNTDSFLLGQNSLTEIVKVGGRALQWVDLFQKNVPENQREQIWRRIDRIGHEATIDNPMVYNPQTILSSYQDALDHTPASVKIILSSSEALPEQIPHDTNIQEVMTSIRKIHMAYSRASRWLALYPLRAQIRKDLRDLRPWIAIDRQKEALKNTANDWANLTGNQKTTWVRSVSNACAIGGLNAVTCNLGGRALIRGHDGSQALQWLEQVLSQGQEAYNSKFGVTHPHQGVTVHQDQSGQVNIIFSMLHLTDHIFSWIAQQVAVGWHFPSTVSATVVQTETPFSGVVKVDWQRGALPHVDSVGGDKITMDSNTATWLEHAQVTMTHEFGHVIGFPDCYVEFWDNNAQSFVFYTLDPDDRMCALSGGTLERHKQALLAGFGH